MNSEQLQEWLSDVNARCKRDEKALQEVGKSRHLLAEESHKTHLLIAYMNCNYADIDLAQPIFAQILACYYRGGVLRYFALQFVPSFIHLYLLALAKRQKRSICMLETFFIAMYNEEILVAGPGSSCAVKKVDEIRIPSIRYPSVYHDPKKLASALEVMPPKPGTPAFVQMTVTIGPYESVDRLSPENRQTVLTRLLKSVNSCLHKLPTDVVCRHLCLSTLALCQSGFSFPESDFRSKFFGMESSSPELLDDYSKKPRIRLSSQYLLEALNGVYYALFNGAPELAIRAIDAVHQRAMYELFADVLLVTNSVRNSLLESVQHMRTDDSLALKRTTISGYINENRRKRSEMVTNASLRVKKMPEDISVLVDAENPSLAHRKESSSFVEGVEGLRKKIVMKIDQRKTSGAFGHHRRRTHTQPETGGGGSDIELDPISEEARQTDAIIERLAETPTESSSPEHGTNGLSAGTSGICNNSSSPSARNSKHLSDAVETVFIRTADTNEISISLENDSRAGAAAAAAYDVTKRIQQQVTEEGDGGAYTISKRPFETCLETLSSSSNNNNNNNNNDDDDDGVCESESQQQQQQEQQIVLTGIALKQLHNIRHMDSIVETIGNHNL